MKSLVIIFYICFFVSVSQAETFQYAYQDVFSPNAGQYVVSSSNIEAVSESNNDYLCPIVSGEQAQITYKFSLDGPIVQASLDAQLGMFNFSGSSGSGSLWASTDGADWQLLVDGPTPSSSSAAYVYDQDLPASLLGDDTIYIQARLLSSGDSIFAQFSRTDDAYNASNPNFNIFTFNAETAPEPRTWDLLLLGMGLLLSVIKVTKRGKRCLDHLGKTAEKGTGIF